MECVAAKARSRVGRAFDGGVEAEGGACLTRAWGAQSSPGRLVFRGRTPSREVDEKRCAESERGGVYSVPARREQGRSAAGVDQEASWSRARPASLTRLSERSAGRVRPRNLRPDRSRAHGDQKRAEAEASGTTAGGIHPRRPAPARERARAETKESAPNPSATRRNSSSPPERARAGRRKTPPPPPLRPARASSSKFAGISSWKTRPNWNRRSAGPSRKSRILRSVRGYFFLDCSRSSITSDCSISPGL